nr:MAG TPA: hypothetical protein [Caudoviricetes sp.]
MAKEYIFANIQKGKHIVCVSFENLTIHECNKLAVNQLLTFIDNPNTMFYAIEQEKSPELQVK